MTTKSGYNGTGPQDAAGDAGGHGSAAETPRIALIRCECCSTPSLGPALAESGVEILELPLSENVQGGRREGDLRRFRPDTVVAGICRTTPYLTLSTLGAVEAVLEDPLVLLLTPDMHYEMLAPYMEAGVDDVVNPPHSATAILLRRYIQLHGPGRFGSSPTLQREVRLGSLMIDVPRRQVSGDDAALELSSREFELLLQLMEADGAVVSRTELMSEIWGADDGSESVLDATVHRLRKKLNRAGEEGTRVSTVRGVGYQLDLESSGEVN